ncbi:MAG: extracellular solute-binding protein [Chloroflexota bacterium]
MKSRNYFLILISLLITVSMLLAACAPAATPTAEPTQPAPTAVPATEVPPTAVPPTAVPTVAPITIRYWHTMSDPESAQFQKVIDAFQAANPGVTIEATRYAYNDFKTAILTAIAGGDVPDTARLDIVWVPEFASQGALMQLDGALPGFDKISASVFPGPLATNKFNGHFYGLPQDTNTQVLLYNKDLFDKAGITAPPATMEEFAADACKLTDKAKKTYGYAEGGTYFWAPAPVFYAMGGKVVDENITTATGYVNGPESVAAFTMLKDLYDKGCLSPNLLGGGIATDAGHATGIYSMIIDGPWMVDIYKGNYPDFKVNFAPVPAGKNGTSSVVGGEDVVVLDGSKNKEAAGKWVEYLMSIDAQKIMAEVGVMPTIASLTGDPSMPAHFAVFMEQLKTAQARVPSPKWGDMDGAIGNAYQRMLKGDQTVQAALDQAAEEINALLK